MERMNRFEANHCLCFTINDAMLADVLSDIQACPYYETSGSSEGGGSPLRNWNECFLWVY